MLQLPLSIQLRVDATFDNFYVSSVNTLVVDALRYFVEQDDETYFYLWGASGSGVSHLLQAAQHLISHQAQNQQHRSAMTTKTIQYLPLASILDANDALNTNAYTPEEVLSGLEYLDMVVIDDIQCLAGKPLWEQGMFHCFNRLRDSGKKLLIGGDVSPKHLEVTLPDLHSRLQWGVTYQLQSLDDASKKQALHLRAKGMGLSLSEDTVQFLLNHCSRDTAHLMEQLQQLDQACLIEKRPVTIPFVKQVLGV